MMKRLGLAIFCLLLGADFAFTPAWAEAGIQTWNSGCRNIYKQYKQKPKHKAFAVSNISVDNSAQSCGSSWAASSKSAAEAGALRICRSSQVAGTCRITKSE